MLLLSEDPAPRALISGRRGLKVRVGVRFKELEAITHSTYEITRATDAGTLSSALVGCAKQQDANRRFQDVVKHVQVLEIRGRSVLSIEFAGSV